MNGEERKKIKIDSENSEIQPITTTSAAVLEEQEHDSDLTITTESNTDASNTSSPSDSNTRDTNESSTNSPNRPFVMEKSSTEITVVLPRKRIYRQDLNSALLPKLEDCPSNYDFCCACDSDDSDEEEGDDEDDSNSSSSSSKNSSSSSKRNEGITAHCTTCMFSFHKSCVSEDSNETDEEEDFQCSACHKQQSLECFICNCVKSLTTDKMFRCTRCHRSSHIDCLLQQVYDIIIILY